MPETLLTVRDVCQRLHITKQAVSLMIASGSLPARVTTTRPQRGPLYRIRETDLVAYQQWRATGRHGAVLCPDDYTVADAARRLGTATNTLYHWIHHGLLRAHRHGRKRWAIRRHEVERLLANRRWSKSAVEPRMHTTEKGATYAD